MFERPQSGEQAILVHMELYEEEHRENLNEFQELSLSAGAVIVEIVTMRRARPEARYFVGSGKVKEIAQLVASTKADLVLFNHALSPSQERNLEKELSCRVLDRTGLILDIFAQRARSFEGKLQVELAQLRHLSTRLIRGWTHLERQKGGIGLRGPGETQLETDRRLLAQRIKQINKRLSRVRSQRAQGRQARRKAEVPTVALVGYTNAGKSTLFNVLTESDVYVQDQLFATLDPTLRKFELGKDRHAILADTVGFIRHLPHELIAAFRSTLQETGEAHLLLHVIDASDERRGENIHEVEQVLSQIGADDIPCIHVMNKIDKTQGVAHADSNVNGLAGRVWLSAVNGEGMDALRSSITDFFREQCFEGEVCLPPDQARVRSLLFGLGAVENEYVDEKGYIHLKINTGYRQLKQLISRENLSPELFIASGGEKGSESNFGFSSAGVD